MADPTAAQRRLFAKMGVAMPDGSYYIRNGPQGPGDLQNAIDAVGRGESAGKSGNVIRKHIMARAAALKLSSKIPDTWCADGSLKPAEHDAMTLTDFFEHHGVKGMHWGVRNADSKSEEGGSGSASPKHQAKHDKLIQKAEQHEIVSAGHARAAKYYQSEAAEVARKGLDSSAGRRVYGNNAANEGPGLFYIKNNQTRGEAVDQLQSNLRVLHNQHARAANRHSAKAVKLRNKAAQFEHDGLNFDPNFEIDEYLSHFIDSPCMSETEYLRHFGVKGMHWGVRKTSGEPSPDHVRAVELKTKVKSSGGVHVLSNDDLKALNERLNLESNYSRLSPEEVSAGQKFTNHLLGVGGNVANQQANKYANKAAGAAIDHLISEAGRQHKSRQRNAPLRVVSIK